MVATKAMLTAHRLKLAKQQQWDWFVEEEAPGEDALASPACADDDAADAAGATQALLEDPAVFLPFGIKQRLDGWKNFALPYLAPPHNARIALVNLHNNADFSKSVSIAAMPTLLTKSYLWDMKTNTEVLPILHWLVMGIAVPHLSDCGQATCPFPRVFAAGQELKDGETRKLTGNMMHQAAIGSLLLFGLCVTEQDCDTDFSS